MAAQPTFDAFLYALFPENIRGPFDHFPNGYAPHELVPPIPASANSYISVFSTAFDTLQPDSAVPASVLSKQTQEALAVMSPGPFRAIHKLCALLAPNMNPSAAGPNSRFSSPRWAHPVRVGLRYILDTAESFKDSAMRTGKYQLLFKYVHRVRALDLALRAYLKSHDRHEEEIISPAEVNVLRNDTGVSLLEMFNPDGPAGEFCTGWEYYEDRLAAMEHLRVCRCYHSSTEAALFGELAMYFLLLPDWTFGECRKITLID